MSNIFVLFVLSMIVQSAFAWWAAAVRGIEPIILSFGAAFTALGLYDQKKIEPILFGKYIGRYERELEKKADAIIKFLEKQKE